jgi:hypothetical protein
MVPDGDGVALVDNPEGQQITIDHDKWTWKRLALRPDSHIGKITSYPMSENFVTYPPTANGGPNGDATQWNPMFMDGGLTWEYDNTGPGGAEAVRYKIGTAAFPAGMVSQSQTSDHFVTPSYLNSEMDVYCSIDQQWRFWYVARISGQLTQVYSDWSPVIPGGTWKRVYGDANVTTDPNTVSQNWGIAMRNAVPASGEIRLANPSIGSGFAYHQWTNPDSVSSVLPITEVSFNMWVEAMDPAAWDAYSEPINLPSVESVSYVGDSLDDVMPWLNAATRGYSTLLIDQSPQWVSSGSITISAMGGITMTAALLPQTQFGGMS